jgi:hypothetical protein
MTAGVRWRSCRPSQAGSPCDGDLMEAHRGPMERKELMP